MLGNLADENLKGIIPRATSHIFDYINKCDIEVDFVINCSMLEIYKETLYDLFCVEKNDLKIKESPCRGIYVEGLT